MAAQRSDAAAPAAKSRADLVPVGTPDCMKCRPRRWEAIKDLLQNSYEVSGIVAFSMSVPQHKHDADDEDAEADAEAAAAAGAAAFAAAAAAVAPLRRRRSRRGCSCGCSRGCGCGRNCDIWKHI